MRCHFTPSPSKQSEPFVTVARVSPSSTPLSFSPSICPTLTPLSPSAHMCCESEQWSTGSPEYYLKNFHSSSRLLVSPSICCPEPKGNMGFTKRARAAENAITAYPSRFPSFSLLIQGNAGMARTCSPLRRARCSSRSFFSPLFLLPPSSPFLPFCLLTRLVSPYRPFCCHSSVSLSPPSLFRSLVLRGNSPAPLRSLFHPLFLSL